MSEKKIPNLQENEKSEATKITLKNVTKTFHTFRGSVEVLKSLDLKIYPGEFFVLLGPSGCGKSTTLNLIAGLEKPSSGTISFSDKTVADSGKNIFLLPFERDVSFVFQNYAIYPHMTIEKNIEFPLTNLKKKISRSQRSERVRKTAQTLQIQHLLNRKPSELSGGQRQRVAIGRAIVRNPSVFLMDEPLSNLDAKLRMEMRAELKAIQKRLGITTVYVTHDQVEAMTLGDRIAILDQGIIQQTGSPDQIYSKPSNKFVASFIGSPPMNILTGKTVTQGEETLFSTQDFTLRIKEPLSSMLKPHLHKEILLGIRPEHFSLTDHNPDLIISFNVTENLGSEYLLHSFMKGGGNFIVSAPYCPENKEKVPLSVDMNEVHMFDSETGERLR
ncbi:Maltose/maltodextrin transport ATP-binding protein MalK [Chitinispirillum alkaliphilum]|nr:Maltose/maltodextrin transport ATP-binding protein MalK [Chitinispirillum alkaliphilum]